MPDTETVTVIHYNPCDTHGLSAICGPECCTCARWARVHAPTCPATYNPAVHDGQVTSKSGAIDAESRYDVYYTDLQDRKLMRRFAEYDGSSLARLFRESACPDRIVARRIVPIVRPQTECWTPGTTDCDAKPTFTIDYGVGGTPVCEKHLAATVLWCSQSRKTLIVTRITPA